MNKELQKWQDRVKVVRTIAITFLALFGMAWLVFLYAMLVY